MGQGVEALQIGQVLWRDQNGLSGKVSSLKREIMGLNLLHESLRWMSFVESHNICYLWGSYDVRWLSEGDGELCPRLSCFPGTSCRWQAPQTVPLSEWLVAKYALEGS